MMSKRWEKSFGRELLARCCEEEDWRQCHCHCAVMPFGNNELSLVLTKLQKKSKTNIMSTYSGREK